MRIRSTDQGGLFTEKAFVVSVTNVNEDPTEVALSALTLAENAGANATIGEFTSSDPDAGSTFTYSLVAGTGDTDNAAFNIQGSTLRATNSFNFETKSSYLLRIRSTDQGGLFTEKAFVVSVTNVNEGPTEVVLSAAIIAENANANTTIGTLSTSDPDAGGTFSYSLVSGVGDIDNDAFSIVGSALLATHSFDFETKSNYTVRIRSTDQGGLFTERKIEITVTNVNEKPTNIDLSSTVISEGQPLGTVVGQLSTQDPDANQTFTYSLVQGTGSDDNDKFSTSGTSLATAQVFDFQAKSSYRIRIRSTDQGSLSREQVFSITVRDITPPKLISIETSESIPNPTNGSRLEFLATFSEAVKNVTASSFVVSSLASAQVTRVSQVSPASYLVEVSGGDLGAFDGTVKLALSTSPLIADLSGNTIQLSAPPIDELFLVDHRAPLVTVDQIITNQVRPAISGTVDDVTATVDVLIGATTYPATNEGNGRWRFDGANLSSGFQSGRHDIRVLARDAADNLGQDGTTEELLVLLHAPTNLQFTQERVHEQVDSLMADVLFGHLGAQDLDPVDTLRFELTSGLGSQDNGIFVISEDRVYLKKGTLLDFESKPQYSIRVKCLDLVGQSIETAVVLQLQQLSSAQNDQFSIVQGRQLTIDVKANDLAPENNLGQLTFKFMGPSSSSRGKVEVAPDGGLLLTAYPNAYGVFEVIYRLVDPRGGESNDAKIRIGIAGSAKQNPWFQLDVDGNGRVTPTDALLVINLLNDPSKDKLVPDGIPSPTYLDVNGNGRVSPSDALLVIDYLNARATGEGEAIDDGRANHLVEIVLNSIILGNDYTEILNFSLKRRMTGS
ncbi:MAG: cadherin domain-containing protein [Pirellulales bacterium]